VDFIVEKFWSSEDENDEKLDYPEISD